MTAREEAERVLQGLPEESMPAALEALEGEVDTSVVAILARHGESRLSPERPLGLRAIAFGVRHHL